MEIIELILELLSFNTSEHNFDDRKRFITKLLSFLFIIISILSVLFIITKINEINSLPNTLVYILKACTFSILSTVVLFFIMVKTRLISQIDSNNFLTISIGLLLSLFSLFIVIEEYF